jgi:hypothetical protein
MVISRGISRGMVISRGTMPPAATCSPMCCNEPLTAM